MKTLDVLEVIGLLLVWLLLEVMAAPLKLIVWALGSVVRGLDRVGRRLM